VADPRPWVTYFNESDKRFKAYLAAGGDPPGRTAEELENLPEH
jgi:hypothetical protein